MKKNFKILIIFAILLVGCLCISSAFATDAHVTGSDFSNIQNAITQDNMVIYLDNHTYTGNSQIEINNDNIIIYGGKTLGDGLSSTLDAKEKCRIMKLSDKVKTITFVNINFINGKADNGGAIYSEGDVTISSNGTSFVNNVASISSDFNCGGGAIYSEGAMTISSVNTSFVNNVASSSASGHFGGGAIHSAGAMTISSVNTSFIGGK